MNNDYSNHECKFQQNNLRAASDSPAITEKKSFGGLLGRIKKTLVGFAGSTARTCGLIQKKVNLAETNPETNQVGKIVQNFEEIKVDTKFIDEKEKMNDLRQGLKTKLHRAATKLARIGKGMAEIKKQGVQGKMLMEGRWLEAASEKHFYCTDRLMAEWERSGENIGFDDWAKHNYIPFHMDRVKYCKNEAERLPYKVDFSEGKAYRTGVPFNTELEETAHTGKGWAIFVIDPKGELYASSHIKGTFHHSSFLNGGAIRGAGEIKTDSEGKIIELSSKSGHYLPEKEQTLDTLRCLEKNGVDLTHVKYTELVIEFDRASNKEIEYFNVYQSAKDYLDSGGECPSSETTKVYTHSS